MDTEELAQLKKYMYVDADTDDELIKSLYCSAVEYMSNAGVTQKFAGTAAPALYKLCAYGLTLSYYDKRFSDSSSLGLEAGLQNRLTQLQLLEMSAKEAASESD